MTQLLDGLSPSLWIGALVFFRIGAAFLVLPVLGEQFIPARIRLATAGLVSLCILPAVLTDIEPPPASFAGVFYAVSTESINGLLLGLGLRLLMIALQTAGSIAAQSTSLSHILGGAGAEPMPAIGHVLSISALALLMATGFHIKLAAFFVLSYQMLPAIQFPSPGLVAQTGRSIVGDSFALALGLAAPFVVLSVLYNLTLGVINKAMPQLMVAFVGAPVITLGAIGLLLFCAPAMLMVWLNVFEAFVARPFR